MNDSGESTTAEPSPEAVFEVLNDERCRRILEAVRSGPKTAPELAESLEIPPSTVYRKLDTLVDAGLVSDSNRVCRNGNHSTQYQCRIGGLYVDIDVDSLTVNLVEERSNPDRESIRTTSSPLPE